MGDALEMVREVNRAVSDPSKLLQQMHGYSWTVLDACWCRRKPKRGHTRACAKERRRRGLK